MKKLSLTEATIKALKGKLQEAPNVEGQMSFDDLEQPKDANKEEEVVYTTEFNLQCPVNDYDAAASYLTDDDMTQYLDEDWDFKDDIVKVEWDLQTDDSGEIIVTAKRELTDDELNKLSNWIAGQNSDGLGEGFEQQDFAETYFNPINGDGPFTRSEAQDEIDALYDEIDASKLIYDGYLTDAVWEAVEDYKNENGEFGPDGDEMDDDEIYDLIAADPEDYLDEDTIEDARQEYIKGNPEFNENDWYTTASFDWKYNKYKLNRVK